MQVDVQGPEETILKEERNVQLILPTMADPEKH